MIDKVFVVRCDELPSGSWTPGEEVEVTLEQAVALIKLGTVKAPNFPRYAVPAEWAVGIGEQDEQPEKVFKKKVKKVTKDNGDD